MRYRILGDRMVMSHGGSRLALKGVRMGISAWKVLIRNELVEYST